MSEHNVVKFADRVLADPELRARCEAAPDMAALVSIAAEAGLRFSAEDVRSYSARLRQAHELDENQLDAAAGGAAVVSGYSDPAKVTITNNHLGAPPGVTINNNHRDLFGLFVLP